jgi:hypothetical protein
MFILEHQSRSGGDDGVHLMKRRKAVQRKKREITPETTDDLSAVNQALYDAAMPQRGNESAEDPLQDWPESTGDTDRWLDERRGGSSEERGT